MEKLYKKCEACNGCGRVYAEGRGFDNSMQCGICKGQGIVETEVPIEQALEALKSAHTQMVQSTDSFWPYNIEEAIKALEEFLNE